jgi:hypothetical protein
VFRTHQLARIPITKDDGIAIGIQGKFLGFITGLGRRLVSNPAEG